MRILVISLLFFASCSPMDRFNRLVKKYPFVLDEFIISQWDTVIIPANRFDTTLYFKGVNSKDTFILRPIHTTIYTDPQTGSMQVETRQPADTIFVQGKAIEKAEKPDPEKNLIRVALVLLLFAILYLYGKSNAK